MGRGENEVSVRAEGPAITVVCDPAHDPDIVICDSTMEIELDPAADERMQRREELLAQLEVVRQRRRRSRPVPWGQAVRHADSMERRRRSAG